MACISDVYVFSRVYDEVILLFDECVSIMYVCMHVCILNAIVRERVSVCAFECSVCICISDVYVPECDMKKELLLLSFR